MSSIHSPLPPVPSMSDRRNFKLAYMTEIGGVAPAITMSEFHDIIICAGKDVSMDDIREIWPFDEIYFETAYYLYTKIPKSEEKLDRALLNLCSANGGMPYDKIIEYVKENIKDEEKREKLIEVYEEMKNKDFTASKIVEMFEESKHRLQRANIKVYENYKDVHENEDWHHLSSTEDLSSVIASIQRLNADNSSAVDIVQPIEQRITRKSFIIEKNHELTTSISYTFTLHKTQKIQIELSINEKLDSNLTRFKHNIFGILTSCTTNEIFALTTKRLEFSNAVATESIQLHPGQYKFSVKFCQHVKEIPTPSKKETIIENDGKLTKKFKVLLMNNFDVFDLNDDGIIDREEFQLFNLLSGGGQVKDAEWNMLMTKFQTRENGIPMKSLELV